VSALERTRYLVTTSAVGAVGAVGAALFSSLCCAGPAVLAVLGTSGAVAAAQLEPYRLHLVGGAFALLGLGFWSTYRPIPAGGACAVRTGRAVRGVLWLSLLATIVSTILLYRLG
jgi:mercuric ion transport protein